MVSGLSRISTVSVISSSSRSGGKPGLGERGVDAREKARLVELQRRDVDREREPPRPARGGGERGAEHPVAERQDLAGRLGGGDEGGRVQLAAQRVAPAQQRLEARHPAVGEVDVGLVDEVHLPVAERAGEVELEPAAVERRGGVRRLVQYEAVAAVGLGAAERGVGLDQQVGRREVGRRGGDDADARLDDQRAAVEHQRLADRREQPPRQRHLRLVVAGGDDDEAVALEPEQEAARAEHRLQPRAGHREERVAGGAAERLVDRAEAVEVEHQEPGRAGALAPQRRRDQPLGGGARPDRAASAAAPSGAGRRGRRRRQQQRRSELGGVGEGARHRRRQPPVAAVRDQQEAERVAVRPGHRRDRREAGVEVECRGIEPARAPGRMRRRRPVDRAAAPERQQVGGGGDQPRLAAAGVEQGGGGEAGMDGEQPEERTGKTLASPVPHLRAGSSGQPPGIVRYNLQ